MSKTRVNIQESIRDEDNRSTDGTTITIEANMRPSFLPAFGVQETDESRHNNH